MAAAALFINTFSGQNGEAEAESEASEAESDEDLCISSRSEGEMLKGRCYIKSF